MPTQINKDFLPVSEGSESTWRLLKGSSKVVAVDPGDALIHDESASMIEAGVVTRQAFRIDRNFQDSMGTITQIRVFCRYFPVLSAAQNVKLGVALTGAPTWVESGDLSHGLSDWGDVGATLARPGGGAWTEADLRDTTFQFSVKLGTHANKWVRVTSLWIKVLYTPTDEGAGAAPPEFPSRRIRRARLPVPILEANLRADAIDIDLLEDIEVIHSEGPQEDGEGWKEDKWQRRRLRVIENNLNLNDMSVKLRAVDLYDYAAMFWHTGISPFNAKSDEDFPDGPAFLHPGSTETFVRASKAHILNQSNIVVRVNSGIKRIGPDGILLEGVSTNQILNSAFFNGMAAWTAGGAGGLDALDTTQTLYSEEAQQDLGGTNQSLKLTFVDPAGGERFANNTPALVFGALADVALTIWHKNEVAGFPGRFLVQNTTSGNYWNATTLLWGAAAVKNDLPDVTDKFTRFTVTFGNDAANSTILFRVYSPDGLASGANKSAWFSQVQAETRTNGIVKGTSPIPTFAGTVTRADEELKYSNNVGRRVWPVKRGTLIVRLKWFFGGSIAGPAAGDVDLRGVPIVLAYHNANNWALLSYYKTDSIRFLINAGGVRKRAIFNGYTPINEGINVFVARWTSNAGGELGLPSRRMTVFVDGVKCDIEDEHTADMSEVDSGSVLWLGVRQAGFFGLTNIPEPLAAYSHVEILPFCLSDEEIKARP